jgi:hypothetical protein
MGVTVSGFLNFFMLYGPNTNRTQQHPRDDRGPPSSTCLQDGGVRCRADAQRR